MPARVQTRFRLSSVFLNGIPKFSAILEKVDVTLWYSVCLFRLSRNLSCWNFNSDVENLIGRRATHNYWFINNKFLSKDSLTPSGDILLSSITNNYIIMYWPISQKYNKGGIINKIASFRIKQLPILDP